MKLSKVFLLSVFACIVTTPLTVFAEDHDHEGELEHEDEHVDEDEHDDGHGHEGAEEELEEGSPYESSNLWAFEAKSYELVFCTSSNDAKEMGGMIFEILPLQDEAHHEAVNEEANKIFNTFSSEAVHREVFSEGSKITIGQNSSEIAIPTLWRAEFPKTDKKSACVVGEIDILVEGEYMVFAEHATEEVEIRFEDPKTHKALTMIECVTGCAPTQEEQVESNTENWKSAVLASLTISMTSLVGVFVLGFNKRKVDMLVEYMTSFAAGCLLGVVAFHLYPEGTGYLSDLEGWVMGVCVLGGIAFSMAVEQVVHLFLAAFGAGHGAVESPAYHHDNASRASLRHSLPSDGARGSTNYKMQETDAAIEAHGHGHGGGGRPDVSIVWLTAVGDFFHAFTDGVVLAVAFKSCSDSLGWAVTFGVIFHEVPHRLGDFFIFLRAGVGVCKALVINFVASLASLCGVLTIFAVGEVSIHVLGFLLSTGTGALLFIAMTQLLPPMMAVQNRTSMFIHFLSFLCGCSLIFFSALKDVHCEAGGFHHDH